VLHGIKEGLTEGRRRLDVSREEMPVQHPAWIAIEDHLRGRDGAGLDPSLAQQLRELAQLGDLWIALAMEELDLERPLSPARGAASGRPVDISDKRLSR